MSGSEPIVLPRVVAFGFVRVATNACVFVDHDAGLHTSDADFTRSRGCVGSIPSRRPAVALCVGLKHLENENLAGALFVAPPTDFNGAALT